MLTEQVQKGEKKFDCMKMQQLGGGGGINNRNRRGALCGEMEDTSKVLRPA